MSEDSKDSAVEDTVDDWGSAMAEQAQATAAAPAAPPTDDDWGSAMAEQAQATAAPAAPAPPPPPAPAHVFQPLQGEARSGIAQGDIDRILDVPVQLTAELGRTRITLKNLLQLSQGSIVELDGLAGGPMDVFINGYLIAQGEVVVVNEKYGIRLTDIVTPSERIQKLNR